MVGPELGFLCQQSNDRRLSKCTHLLGKCSNSFSQSCGFHKGSVILSQSSCVRNPECRKAQKYQESSNKPGQEWRRYRSQEQAQVSNGEAIRTCPGCLLAAGTSKQGPGAAGEVSFEYPLAAGTRGNCYVADRDKELGKFVNTFTSFDKAKSSLKRVFSQKVFDRAGKGRNRFAGRSMSSHNVGRGSRNYWQSQHQQEPRERNTFLQSRGISWRQRGGRRWQKPRSFSGFLSNLFLVKKKDAGYRPVINLKDLNRWVTYQHFKMEGIHNLRDLILPEDWLTKIDLQDAYLTVPIHVPHQRFLQFQWKNVKYQFTCLPFGLTSAPWCFTKLMKPVISLLRSRGIRLIIYLDDILIMSQSEHQGRIHTQWTIKTLTSLGFVINQEKSVLIPQHQLEFLGFSVNSIHASLSLPTSKLSLIKKEIRSVLSKGLVSLRKIARIIGMLSASIQAIFPAPLHYRALQRFKNRHLQAGRIYQDLVPLTVEAREELLWWLKHVDAWNGKAIFSSLPDIVIESDASQLGWGARCGYRTTGGRWSSQEVDLHINCLELLAGSFALKSFAKDKVNCCVLLKMDNVSAVRYINRLGGTRSRPLTELAKDFWHFCLDRGITIQAEYIPGLLNTVADWNSRYLKDSSDWRLHQSIFQRLADLWGPFQVDLFASRLNAQLPKFFSWRPDPEALAVDAFLQDWSRDLHYAFPPFCMIPRVASMVRTQKATIVLITPLWQ
ncbi:uncharacterized protein LOC128471763 [Spea bombifrons]|uniref:uncharacterized protein LOC128471763 n=1 Tax=Spea bombifrons TaxID=233779 RepID=UPI00234BF76A|nr:uncharacterized protein LOC128471763 [Spea bombifrons]